MSASVERVETALREHACKGANGSWCCPAHEDRSPSLSVAEGADGRALVKCHAGCATADVLAAVGLTEADLFETVERPTVVAEYAYRDESGDLLFVVERRAPKDFRQRRPDPERPGGWIWNLQGVRRVLYRLPSVAAAVEAGRTVYVVEGEKDAEAIVRAGGEATCNPGGAGKWREEYAEALRGARVVIVADTDDPGRAHAATVAASVRGVAERVKVVEAAEGKDAADHLAAGHGPEDFRPVVSGPIAEPRPFRVVSAEEFSAVDEASAEPLLGDDETTVLAAGGSAVFYGKGGGGKTTLIVDLAAHLAAGTSWLGLPVPHPCTVLLIENEGPRGKFRRKLRAKLAAWDGPSTAGRLHVLDTPWATFTFADAELRALLVEAIREHGIEVLAAGPVHRLGVTGGGTPEEVREFVGLIEDVRAGLDRPLAGVFVHHPNKAGTVSGDWEGVPDTLAHVSALGHGATRIEWEKVRWGSSLQGRAWKLLWREGEAFALDETPEITDDDIRAGVLAAIAARPGCSWRAVQDAMAEHEPPLPRDRARALLDRLIEAGEIVNRGGSGKGGPGGGGFKLHVSESVSGAFPDTPDTVSDPDRAMTGRGGVSGVRPVRADTPSARTVTRAGERGRVRPDTPRCPSCEMPFARNGPGEPYCRCPDADEIPTGSLFEEDR